MERAWSHPSAISVVVVAVVAIVGTITAYILTERTGDVIAGTGVFLTIGMGVLSLYNQRSEGFESVIVGGLWATLASLVVFVAYSLTLYIALTFGYDIRISTIISVVGVLSVEESVRIFLLR